MQVKIFLKLTRCIFGSKQAAFDSITFRGYKIKGIVVNGRLSLFKMLPDVPVQMCQFHMIQIVRRYITLNPKMHVCRELRDIVNKIYSVSYVDFKSAYEAWRAKWKSTIYIQRWLSSL